MTDPAERPSVGRSALPLVDALVADAAALRLKTSRGTTGAVIVDAGIATPGSLEAGRRIALICMGGLGQVTLGHGGGLGPFSVTVGASDPVTACLLAQYAGWSLHHEQDGAKYGAMASGPGRARAARESLFQELAYSDDAPSACFVLETDKVPPDGLIAEVARTCGLPPQSLTFILTPTSSLAGTVQITARVLEVALHKLHTLGFPLDRVADGLGSAPIPPPAPKFLDAMGRTNDAILFGGMVQLFVRGPDDDARELAERLPSSASRDYGKPFAQVFKEAEYDFYKIDGMLFSPARVVVTALDSGRSFSAGRVDPALVARSFGID